MMMYIGAAICVVACAVWIIGRIVTENAGWGVPWVWVVFGLGLVVIWLSPFVG